MKINKSYAPIVVRGGIALVFLWMGIDIWVHTDYWVTLLPGYVSQFIEPQIMMLMTGVFDFVFGLLLLLGLFTRISALLMALHLIGVINTLGYNDIAVRDFGLLLATIGIFLYGPDKWCLDKKYKNRFRKKFKWLYFFD